MQGALFPRRQLGNVMAGFVSEIQKPTNEDRETRGFFLPSNLDFKNLKNF